MSPAMNRDANDRVELFVPFATTASNFHFEVEPYFNTAANQYLGVRVWELDVVITVPEHAAGNQGKAGGRETGFRSGEAELSRSENLHGGQRVHAGKAGQRRKGFDGEAESCHQTLAQISRPPR